MNILLPGHPSNRVSVLQSVASSHQQTNTIHESYDIKDNYQLIKLQYYTVELQTSFDLKCFRKLMDAAKFHCL